jgi:ATP-dependent helicase HrpA
MNKDEYKEIQNKFISNRLLLPQDRIRLGNWIKKLQKIKNATASERHYKNFKHQLDLSLEKKQKHLIRPKITYPSTLPITSKVSEIKELIDQNQVVIVSGSTGSGKTTQLPKILLDMGFGENGVIGCTQPRRIAATGMAGRVAEEINCTYGKEVGCQIRFDRKITDDTLVKFMTDGVLLSESVNDKLLLQYSALIIDEVHERSLNIDFILGYLKRLLRKRKDLKVIISSATLDSGGFSDFFNGAPVVEVEGRTFPVEDIFLPAYDDEDLTQQCCRAVEWITELDAEGDILIFMPGEREIRDAVDMLKGRKFRNTHILSLYGRISIAEQCKVFSKERNRRIIVSTNVAETSITIPGIHYVVDSGFARVNRYIPKTQIQMLQVEQISKASAKQRRGRCGRISEGVCVYLYDKEIWTNAPDYTDPEICRTSLGGVILQMKMLNLPDIEEFPFLDMPSIPLIREGKKGLREIGALDKGNHLTEEGRLIAGFPVDPRFAKMICEAKREKVLLEVLAIVSYLSIQDPRERPEMKRMAADQAHAKWRSKVSDFVTILNLWNFIVEEVENGASKTKIRNLCKKEFLNYRRVKEWFNLYYDLGSVVENLGWIKRVKQNTFYDYNYDLLHMSILSGFPMNIGQKLEGNLYQSTGNRRFLIFPGSGVLKTAPQWIVGFPFVETSRLFGRNVAEINTEWLEIIAPHLCKKKYYDIHWDGKDGFVYAKESISFSGIVIKSGKRVYYGNIDLKVAREIFIRDGLVPGDMVTRHRCMKNHKDMLDRICHLGEKIRKPDALLNEDAVFDHFDNLIPEDICSVKELESWLYSTKKSINLKIQDAIYPELIGIKEEDYPDTVVLNNLEFELDYKYDPGDEFDGVTFFVYESELLLIPEWITDWIVPGFLEEKVQLLIKSLPKDIRMKCFPVKKVIADFMLKVNAGEIIKEQFLLLAISSFLQDEYDIFAGIGDFDTENLPNYLIMNIAVLDDDTGKIKNVSRGLSNLESGDIKSVCSTVVGLDKWTRASLKTWPDFDIPDEVVLNEETKLKGYPAIVDEGDSVGVKVFMDEDEAEFNHVQGLVALFRINFYEQCRFIEKKMTISNSAVFTLGSVYSSNKYKADILNAAIGTLLTDRGMVLINSSALFERQCECVLEKLYPEVEKNIKTVENIIKEKDEVNTLLLKFIDVSHEIYEDIRKQIDILLRVDFLKVNYAYTRYLRYMKALKIRVQRLGFATDKDLEKIQEIVDYQNAIDGAVEDSNDVYNMFSLVQSIISLQEYRIKLFAPELKPFEKISVKSLEDRFKKLFISAKI